MAKINRFECDLCGVSLPNGTEHHITIVYPYNKEEMQKETLYRRNRTRRTIDLCEECFEECLKEFGRKEEER